MSCCFFLITTLYILNTAGLGLFAATIARNLAQVGMLTVLIMAFFGASSNNFLFQPMLRRHALCFWIYDKKELMELSDSYQLKASESGLNLVFENEEELPIIMADTGQLRRVFTNLLDNAIKFSKEKGTIIISTHETAEEVVVEVKDDGMGIEKDELPYVFDTFRRGRDTEKKEGFGLGLAAVKAIVEGPWGTRLC